MHFACLIMFNFKTNMCCLVGVGMTNEKVFLIVYMKIPKKERCIEPPFQGVDC